MESAIIGPGLKRSLSLASSFILLVSCTWLIELKHSNNGALSLSVIFRKEDHPDLDLTTPTSPNHGTDSTVDLTAAGNNRQPLNRVRSKTDECHPQRQEQCATA